MKQFGLKLVASAALVLSTSLAWAQSGTLQGTVLETMNSGGYTYVQLQEGDKQLWAAGPQVELQKGDKVSVTSAGWMKDFYSKTLNRTFADLLFVSKITKK
ncbi:MAG: NrfJ [Shewanella sp.]|nr:NrfJ [Shewanella sp.]MCF1431800.1 NrfJ [Shewanella sp.]MCF1438385.1 NrfJ [Shewanella sp.]MCF1456834.1 NrfJ [Shewanella sp.]